MGIIYLINAVGTKKYKIGFTEVDISKRLRSLQTASPFELELVAQQPGTLQSEQRLHQRLYKFHLRGEWFEFTDRESALLFFHPKTVVKKQKDRVREALPPVQKLANRLMREIFSPLGMTPRFLGMKKWDAPAHSTFYKYAEITMEKGLVPDIAGLRWLLANQDDPNATPPPYSPAS